MKHLQITANRLEDTHKNVSLKMKTKDDFKELEMLKTKVNGNPYLQGCITTYCLCRMNLASEM